MPQSNGKDNIRNIPCNIVSVQDHPPAAILKHRKKIRKILLIQPPAYSNNLRTDMNPNAPLGLAYIGAMLERERYDVSILDSFIEGWDQESRINDDRVLVGLSFEQIRKIVSEKNPDAVGVTSMFTSQRKNAHAVAKIVKEVDPKIIVIFGGAHPTSAPEMVMSDPYVDVAVLAEGDNLIVPLLKNIESDEDIGKLDGLAYRDETGQIIVVEKTNLVTDLNVLPYPARHLLPMEKYFSAGVRHGGIGKGKRAASMITSRGCQYRCNFCTAFKVFTRRPRMRSIENVLGEIDELVNRYGVDELFFEDDQIIAKQRRAGDLFDAIAERYNIYWDTPNGVSPWLLDDEILSKMKAAGCYRVNIAIESGNQWVLDNIINKPVKVDKIPEIIEAIRRHGMEVGTYLVVGNIARDAVETLDQIKESFSFCRKVKVAPHASLLTAYPGSEVLDIAIEKDYLVPGFDWDNLIISKFQLQTPYWTPEQLMNVVEKEQLKTKWWLLLTSPGESIGKLASRFFRTPVSTVKSISRIIGNSVVRFLK